MSTKAMEQYWLRLIIYPSERDRHAFFRDALKQGFEAGMFLRAGGSYYLSGVAINAEIYSWEADVEAEREEAEAEYDPEELLVDYAMWLPRMGYRDVERSGMIAAYAVEVGHAYGLIKPAGDGGDTNSDVNNWTIRYSSCMSTLICL